MLAVWAMVIGFGPAVSGQDEAEARAAERQRDGVVVELRETISKVVEVEMTESREASDWQARKESMDELLGLHRRELALLDEELSKAGASAEQYAAEREKLEGEIAELKHVRGKWREVIQGLRGRVLGLIQRFPKKLAEEVEAQRYALEEWTQDDEPRDAVRAILEVIGAAEQFNRRITRTTEVRDGREVEVIYLGLTRAYYADRSGHAGIGVLGAEGMRWESRAGIAGEVVKALDQLDRKRPPELVELPLQIDQEESP